MQQADFPEKNPSEKATSSPPENRPPVSAVTIPINSSNARASDDRSRVSESTDAARNPDGLTAEGGKSRKPSAANRPRPPRLKVQKKEGSQDIRVGDADHSLCVHM